MSIAPTLQCPCAGGFLQPAAQYEAPPAGETRFDLLGRPYLRAYDRCATCDHWFARHELDLAKLYSGAYVDGKYGDAEGMRRKFDEIMALPVERSDNRQRVARIRAFAIACGVGAPGRARLLDVGAGLGVFPMAMAQAGWEVAAIEGDPRSVEHLEGTAGVRVVARDLLALDPAVSGRFDVITFNKVLEHVEDPVALLAASKRVLLEGGFVYVEVPDVAAASEGPGREEFFIEHHHVFSPASVGMLAGRAGLSPVAIERVREPSTKFTLRAFLAAAPLAP